MSKEAQVNLRDTMVTALADAVRMGVLTQVEAMAACSDACAAIIATMIPQANHAEALDIVIEKLPRQVAFHTAELAAYRKARSN
ncbi:hypothetical protein TAL182_CH01081 [Rhizobium sp. TAL182]|uniref:hypothetical protein n=1 Tax=Rhizobium sp. TAL182 TaxID=2020313 RepID=UPI000A210957|nr:hypothetical protein [Rhizobium sp. TAL182]ARO22894.1 hypothetical protein TAL182_CH01081 [Rhizobium sp. TAL182]